MVVTVAVGLVVPRAGEVLNGAITPLLALLMLAVSLSFGLPTLRAVLRRPAVVLLATVLVYGPMSLLAYGLASATFGSGSLWLGVILLGALPTDVSSPLLVWIGRGDVALATVANAINTALAPLLVPALFLIYTGVALQVPVAAVSAELALVVVLPTIVGATIRTLRPRAVARLEPALSATGSLCYLALLLAVVGTNAGTVLGEPGAVLTVLAVALALNAGGYLIGAVARPLLESQGQRVAMLFTVSKKEFSIAAFVVVSTGLPDEVALPAVVYAVVQMLSSPLVARWLAERPDATAGGR